MKEIFGKEIYKAYILSAEYSYHKSHFIMQNTTINTIELAKYEDNNQ